MVIWRLPHYEKKENTENTILEVTLIASTRKIVPPTILKVPIPARFSYDMNSSVPYTTYNGIVAWCLNVYFITYVVHGITLIRQ